MTVENTYQYPDSDKTACRACRTQWVREYRERQQQKGLVAA